MVKFHGKHLGGVVFEGKQYWPDKDGVFELPLHFDEASRVAMGLSHDPPPVPVQPPCDGCDELRAQVAELEKQLADKKRK